MQTEADVLIPYLNDSLNLRSTPEAKPLCNEDLACVQKVWRDWGSAALLQLQRDKRGKLC
jgi:hypothetical protein